MLINCENCSGRFVLDASIKPKPGQFITCKDCRSKIRFPFPQKEISCPKCATSFYVEENRIKAKQRFKCSVCEQKFIFSKDSSEPEKTIEAAPPQSANPTGFEQQTQSSTEAKTQLIDAEQRETIPFENEDFIPPLSLRDPNEMIQVSAENKKAADNTAFDIKSRLQSLHVNPEHSDDLDHIFEQDLQEEFSENQDIDFDVPEEEELLDNQEDVFLGNEDDFDELAEEISEKFPEEVPPAQTKTPEELYKEAIKIDLEKIKQSKKKVTDYSKSIIFKTPKNTLEPQSEEAFSQLLKKGITHRETNLTNINVLDDRLNKLDSQHSHKNSRGNSLGFTGDTPPKYSFFPLVIFLLIITVGLGISFAIYYLNY